MKILIATNGMAARKLTISFIDYKIKNNIDITLIGVILKSDIYASYLNDLDQIEILDKKQDFTPEKILEIALKHQVDYVHPGWGFLAENAQLMELMEQNNIKICSPSSKAVDICGSKINTIRMSEEVNVPNIPYFTVSTLEEVLDKIKTMELTYPLMFKASDEGGGRGIMNLDSDNDVIANYKKLDLVNHKYYVTKKITNAKHIEVQVLGDHHGNYFVASMRDCSAQRRFQKMIEESLLPGDNPVLKEIMHSAYRLCKHINYYCAGTVEFLYSMDDQKYYFLEINPRLQVEHPCTEAIYDINIPSVMLQITMGKSLYEIFGDKITKVNETDNLLYMKPQGNCIAARITCEDPYNLKPTSGTIQEIKLQTIPGGWGYFCYSNGSVISSENDCQIGHVFAYGKDREEARKKLLYMLDRLVITGTINTSIIRVMHILKSPDFINNRIDTLWVERTPMKPIIDDIKIATTALINGYSRFKNNKKEFVQLLQNGHVPQRELYFRTIDTKLNYNDIEYKFKVERNSENNNKYRIYYDNNYLDADIFELNNNSQNNADFIVFLPGRKVLCCYEESEHTIYSNIDGILYEFSKKGSNELRADIGGKFIRKYIEDGIEYKEGEVLADFEIMKMQYSIYAPSTGSLKWKSYPGQYVNKGELLGIFLNNDTSKVVAKGIDMVCIANVVDDISKLSSEETDYSSTIYQMLINNYRTDQIINFAYNTKKNDEINTAVKKSKDISYNEILQLFNDVFGLNSMNRLNKDDTCSISGVNTFFINNGVYCFVLVIHDNSVNNGSLGTSEYANFVLGSQYAKTHKIPFVYISTCTGAKIGVYDKILDDIRVKQSDNGDFEYFYVDNIDAYNRHQQYVSFEQVDINEWKINWIEGDSDSGVENLHGSGQIAMEMGSLYDAVPTMTYVTKYSVGIGAYVSVLGRRIIQKKGSPLLLTGYQALNKLLGKNLYINNQQLGDTHIMTYNGITMLDVANDINGIEMIKLWYDMLFNNDIEWAYNYMTPLKSYKYLFDNGQMVECYSNWGQSAIGGYARIGEKTVGVIIGNDEVTIKRIPSDPGNMASTKNEVVYAGNVLYPDTSHKIAQMISNFNRDGLPLVIIANFVGFSGGTRDMFEKILKFGSKIVDELRLYKQKVIIYIPRGASLRGGTYVVFAKSINPEKITIYADPTAEMNVLEPSGLAEIKCRKWNQTTQIKEEFCKLHDSAYRAKAKHAIDDVIDTMNIKTAVYNKLFV